MRDTRLIMGMPITVDIVDPAKPEDMKAVFAYFESVDARFSTYKEDSEVMRMNRGEVPESELSDALKEVLALAERTKEETNGYFDIERSDGSKDPSGIVKGWAILQAARMLTERGCAHFFIDAGGDIQTAGRNASGEAWSVGIRNPFNRDEIVQVLYPQGSGVATSGTYVRGQHIYNPHARSEELRDIVSLTVVGPDVFEADRFATAAFAMGHDGIRFVEAHPSLQGYSIDAHGTATYTSGFMHYSRTPHTV
jgi:thiamine biosynthesis lipoprotein